MAKAAAPAEGGSPLKAITRKVGPLPLWAYAAILVVAWFLYRRMKGGTGSATSGPAADTTQTDQNTYVPGFDAAGAGGGGGIGSTGTPGVVNNYYYGDQAGAQALGGGTASIPPDRGGVMTPGGGSTGGLPTSPRRPIDIPLPGGGTPPSSSIVTQPPPAGNRPITYYVPSSGRLPAGTAL